VPLKTLKYPPSEKMRLDESILYLAITICEVEEDDIIIENLPQINRQAIEMVGLSDEDYGMIINYSRLETSKIANLINS
jgi:hypothetical protein